MLIFTIIIFGLAVIRTITPLIKQENWTVSRLMVIACIIVAYVWFLKQFVSLN